jgi:hypothetical protein
MPRPLSPWRQAIFFGQDDDEATEVAPQHASVIRNMIRDRGKLVGRKGTRTHTDRNLAGASEEIDGIYWARIRDDDHLFVVHDGDVFDVFPPVPPSPLVNGANKLTPGLPVSFAWIDQKVYAGDGTLPNIRITGSSVATAMMALPSTGMTATVIAGGTLGTGVTYTYKVVFVSADGNESAPSAVVTANAATSAGLQQIQLASIPVATGSFDVASRRLYRISTSGTTWKVLATIADNTSTTYLDTVADASLGDDISTQDRRPMPPCALLIAHEGRLMGACSHHADFDRQTLFISNYREPWYCPAAPDLEDPNQGTEIALQGPAAGEITALCSHGDRVFVFTWDSLHVLIGDQPLDYSLKLSTKVGCVAHRTAVSVRGSLMWLAADGVYEMREGVGLRRVSKPIDTWLKARTAEEIAAAHAFVFDGRYTLCIGDEARVLDLEYSAGEMLQWGEYTAYPWNCSTVAHAGETRLPRVFAGRRGVARIWELETGDDDNGEAIPCVYTSPQWDLGNPGREKRLHFVGATFDVGAGTALVSLSKGTGAVIETFTVDLTTPTEEDGEIVRLFQRATDLARSEHFRISVSHEKTAAYQLLWIDGNWSLAT